MTRGSYETLTHNYIGQDAEKERTWMRGATEAVNSLRNGKVNSAGDLTLTENATSTVVTDIRVGGNSVILLMPKTANAAGALATTYIASVGKQTFTVTHANNAQTDREFAYVALG